jgi:putative DNA primase/helicase
MVNEDGKPIKTDSQHLHEYGDKMTAGAGEGVSVEYFVLPEVFRAEICKGFDYRAVCKILLQHGCLQPANGREYDCKPRLPGIGNAWCYHVTPAIMELEL